MKLSGIRGINMRYYSYFFVFLMLFFAGCRGEKSKPSASTEPYIFSFTEIKELKHQPEIVPDGPCNFKLQTKFACFSDGGINEFYYIANLRGEIIKNWHRFYKNSSGSEFRFYYQREGSHYLLVLGHVDSTLKPFAFYIKWRQMDIDKIGLENLPGLVLDSDIGKYTEYLETNLSREVILKYFPDLQCSILVTKPKKVKMELYHMFSGLNTHDIDPQIEYESAKEKR